MGWWKGGRWIKQLPKGGGLVSCSLRHLHLETFRTAPSLRFRFHPETNTTCGETPS